jgi:ligand-binding SRPBCC domain-containing protein
VPRPYLLHRTQPLPRRLPEVFAFFSRPENLQTITPPWLDFRITQAPPELRLGSRIEYRLRIHRIPTRWTTEITAWNPPHSFVDTQVSGPYTLWRHEHTFTADGPGTAMQDTVRYALPFGHLGRAVHWAIVQRDVNKIFDYRAEKMRELFGK